MGVYSEMFNKNNNVVNIKHPKFSSILCFLAPNAHLIMKGI